MKIDGSKSAMSRVTREIDRVASEWLMRRDSAEWSAEDASHLEAWLSSSTIHRVAFLRLELGWEETRRLKALAAGVRGEPLPPPGHWNLSPFFDSPRVQEAEPTATVATHPMRRKRSWAATVSAAVVALAFMVWLLWPAGERYVTPVGGIASVPIPDGSKITLNTNSQIRVALSTAERRVSLQKGEAFFKVAKDLKRPFVVEAGSRRVIAVGTQFSVRRDGDSVEVVVTEGKVRVEDTTEPVRPDNVAAPVFLTPGSIAHAGPKGVLVQRASLTEAEAQLTWRVGVITFRNATLADAIAEFNRYSVHKIVIATLASLRIEGNFRSDNVAAFLELLEAGFPVRVAEEPDRTVLKSK